MKNLIGTLFFLGIFCLGQTQTIDTLIDVGGYKLHFNIIKGKGDPVLFESGNGSDGTVWKDILSSLHEFTGATLITYDRAGLGLSGIDTTGISLPKEVEGLEVALKKLGYSKKIFLVNHSFGSFYSILFAIRNKGMVAGSVFIDPALSCNYTKKRNKEGNGSVTPELWIRIKKEAPGLYYVLKNYEDICDLMAEKRFPSEIPAVVIGAENHSFLKTDAYKQEWRECVKSFGQLPNHKYVFAENCGHTVWNDNSKIVIDEIVKLYSQVGNK